MKSRRRFWTIVDKLEAIIALEVRGRVEVKKGSAIFVSDSEQSDRLLKNISAFELTQARALIEAEAAALAVSTIKNDELQALKQTLEQMTVSETADEAAHRVHEIIAKSTKNNAIFVSIQNLWELRRRRPQIIAAYEDVCSQGIEQRIKEHTEIYDAIAARDSASARKAMHNHFNRLINALFDASEAKALEEIKRKTDETLSLYSISHLSQ